GWKHCSGSFIIPEVFLSTFNIPALHRLCFAVTTALWYPPCKGGYTNENKRNYKVAGRTGTAAVPADRAPVGGIVGQCKTDPDAGGGRRTERTVPANPVPL